MFTHLCLHACINKPYCDLVHNISHILDPKIALIGAWKIMFCPQIFRTTKSKPISNTFCFVDFRPPSTPFYTIVCSWEIWVLELWSIRHLNHWIWGSELEVRNILVRHLEKELMMVRDLDFKLNVKFVIGVRDEDRKWSYQFLSQNHQLL